MIAPFFINRPIFAAVLSIVITLIGGIALYSLPIAQYPRITPPGVQVSIAYPGASAPVVADTVAAPIEQQVNGVEGMLYMSSQMGNDGSYTLTVTFDLDTDLNTALVMVQNRVALAMPQLPTAVQNQGITIRKKTPDILMIVNFFSPDDRYDDIYLSNFATINIRDELLRVQGVSDVNYLGQRDYSIRAWLDPQELASRDMTAMDVANAIRTQNLDAPAGQLGQAPISQDQAFQLPIDTLGRLTDPEQFGEIVVKVGKAHGSTRNEGLLGFSSSGGSSSKDSSTNAPLQGSQSTSADPTTPAGATTGTSTTSGGAGGSSGSTSTASSFPGGMSSDPSSSQTPVSNSLMTTSNSVISGFERLPGSTFGKGVTGGIVGGGSSTGGGSTSGGGSSAGGGASSGGGNATGGLMSGLMINQSQGSKSSSANQGVGSESLALPPTPPAPSIVRLRHVARVELGAQNYNQACTFDGHPSVGLSVYQLPGTNALDVADRVRAKMQELKSRFPDGIEYDIAYDTTPFIRESVSDVVRTLLEAVVLVGIVVLVFLQNWRAALIPLVAVPVAIVGTFAVMALLGFSLNNISLFGLVLAIGIVVDDAIVVVENVERFLEHGLDPHEATRKAMEEVTGPIIAVALVLCAVFVPCAFISGITGQFFRQFAVTIAVSTVFSAFNSLTLSPALAAILLKRRGGKRDPLTWLLDMVLGIVFRLFNKGFEAGTAAYAWMIGRLLRLSFLVLIGYGGLLVLTYFVFTKAPIGFVPQQDQGRLIVNVQVPDSSSLQRTQAALAAVDKIARKTPGVAHTVVIAGLSFLQSATSSNFGSMFIVLEPFEKRRGADRSADAIMAKLRKAYTKEVRDAQVTVFGAPPIPGLSVAGGFKLMVEDRGGLGLTNLQRQADALTRSLQRQQGFSGVSMQFRSNTPQLFFDIDRSKAESLGVSFTDVNQTLSMYLGSLYVNSFNEFGRHWQVTVQAEGRFRNEVEDINLLQIRNKWGRMVPLGTLVTPKEIGGPVFVTRYNLAATAAINGNLGSGVSTGQAIETIDRLSAKTLPLSMKTEWTELMFMQIRAGNTAMYVFGLAVVCVFLALSALYESWSLPMAVILVVPLCLLCSVAGVLYTDRDVNIFVQIGLVVLVGLACKNSILIVEFARQLHEEGKPVFEATQEACRLRLRPILMTSFAFIFGVFPLVVAVGAGAEMRRSLGVAVFSGMLGVTLFGIFLTPVFFFVIQGVGETKLFSAARTRWLGSILLGTSLGLVVGYLFGRLGVVRPAWGLGIGACVGLLVGLALQGLHGKIWPRSPAKHERQGVETSPPAQPIAGPSGGDPHP
ncbi:efflux RND transporter permease subunit [Singulisphaera sp. PoT]|uniref:efflux RND transporter permease subunit n=1 Tax=Singulisphaera sp. PoT TaxID=3411797 RepID=UPI003BF5A3C2